MTAIDSIAVPLFVPANRPERFAKAATSGADAVILDLEDAVAPEAKEVARASLTADFTDLPVIVRINAAGTQWYEDDLAAVGKLPVAAIMLPKSERVEDLARVARVLPVIALVESVRGIASARALAASGHTARLAFGSIDYASELGAHHQREPLLAARSELVFASRLGHCAAPFDGVTTDVDSAEAARSDAEHANKIGFGGKLAIHPRQIEPIKAGFRPSEKEIAWARAVLAAGDGAVRVDGQMIDAPVRMLADAILARVYGLCHTGG